MNRTRGQAGMTLVELMIVVAIIGLMAAVGIPSFKGLMPRVKLRNNAMVLSNEIALARVRAISKSYDFRIVFNPAPDNSYTIYRYNGAWQSLGTTVISPTVLVGANILPSTALNPANTLEFAGNGQVTNVPLGEQAAIELSSGEGHGRRIVVEPTGRMFVQRWSTGAGGGWIGE